MESSAEVTRIMIGWPGATHFSETDSQLGLVGDLLARVGAGRLYAELVRTEHVADRVDAYSDIMGDRAGRIFWISVDVHKGVDPERAIESVTRVVHQLATAGPSAPELALAQQRELTKRVRALESVTRRADLLGQLHDVVGSDTAFESLQTDVLGATPASVRETVRRALPTNRRVVVVASHDSSAAACGRLRGHQ